VNAAAWICISFVLTSPWLLLVDGVMEWLTDSQAHKPARRPQGMLRTEPERLEFAMEQLDILTERAMRDLP
jgi:hypothetical protein